MKSWNFQENGHGKSWKSHGVSSPDLCGNPVQISWVSALKGMCTAFRVNVWMIIFLRNGVLLDINHPLIPLYSKLHKNALLTLTRFAGDKRQCSKFWIVANLFPLKPIQQSFEDYRLLILPSVTFSSYLVWFRFTIIFKNIVETTLMWWEQLSKCPVQARLLCTLLHIRIR